MTRVLVVDDEPALLEITKAFLESKWDFEVDTAPLAREAMEKLKQRNFDALVVDYQMPEVNGIRFLKELRGSGSNVPFILFTGRGREDVAIEALNSGADFYLQKGGDPKAQFAELANMIRQSVAKRQAMTDLLQLAAVVESSHDGIIGIGLDNRVVSWNPGASKIYGYSWEEIKGQPVTNLVPESLRDEYLATLDGVKNGSRIEHLETTRIRKDGRGIQVSLTLSPMKGPDGNVNGVSIICRDMTDEKEIQRALVTRLAYEDLLNTLSASALSVRDVRKFLEDAVRQMGETLDVSRVYLFAFDLPSETMSNVCEWVSQGVDPVRHGEQNIPLKSYEWWISLVHANETINVEDVKDFPSEEERAEAERQGTRSTLAVPLKLSGGSTYGFLGFDDVRGPRKWSQEDVGILRSISVVMSAVIERDLAEGKLRESEEKYRSLMASAPSIIVRVSPSGETLFVNDHIREVTGYAPSELIGRNWYEILYPGSLRDQIDELLTSFGKGDVQGKEMTLRTKDGHLKTVLWNSFNKWDEASGQLLEINGAGIDVTEQKRAQDGLRESGAFNRAVLDALDAHIAVLGKDGRIQAVNSAWGRFNRENSGPDDPRIGAGADYLGALANSSERGDLGAREALDGIRSVLSGRLKRFTLEYSCPSPDRERWFMMTVTPMGRKLGGVVVSHKDITERRLIEKARLEGEQRYRAIFETSGTAMAIIDENSVVSMVNSEFERASGYSRNEIEGKMSWKRFVHPDDQAAVERRRTTHYGPTGVSPSSYELRGLNKDGGVKSFLATVALIPGTRKTIASLIDLTERKKYEEALQQANQKLGLLGDITRHDVLNQLSVMYGYVQLAQAAEKEGKVRDALGKAAAASEIIRKHLEFAKDYQQMGSTRPDWVEVSEVVAEAMKGFEKGRVAFDVRVGGLEVYADQMIEKVFHNLIDNSIRHGEGVGGIRMRAEEHGGKMLIFYEDDGVGIPDGMKERVFERGVGNHTGYGLYLSREVLGITGITIREIGAQGRGAVFEIAVPKDKYRLTK